MDTTPFKAKLEDEKTLLAKELQDLAVTPDETATEFRDELADKLEELDEREATTAALEAQLEEVTKALARIEQGTYGICRVCGEPIEEDRLEANPSATTCKADMEHDFDNL